MNRRRFFLSMAALGSAIGLGAFYWPRRWKYIVIHHSAGNFGNIEFLQQVHRERQANDPIDAIPYHFIIGNGNGLADGALASDFRQEFNLWGAHVSAHNIDRNLRGLGICVIGNLDQQAMTAKQYESLVTLTKELMNTYNISINNISGHGDTPGESTRCPGKYFPQVRFFKDIAQSDNA